MDTLTAITNRPILFGMPNDPTCLNSQRLPAGTEVHVTIKRNRVFARVAGTLLRQEIRMQDIDIP